MFGNNSQLKGAYMNIQYSKYILSLLLFGSNGIVASYIIASSTGIVYLRTLLGSLFLLAIFFFTRQKITLLHVKKDFLLLVLSGIAMGASWIFLFEAYLKIGVSLATVTYYIGPALVMIFSPFLFKEKMTVTKLLGFTIVVVGMVLVNAQTIFSGALSYGLMLGLGSAIMYFLMVVLNKKAASIQGLQNASFQLSFSFLTVFIYFCLSTSSLFPIIENGWFAVIFLGIVNTGIGCYFYFSSIGQLPVQSVSILGYLDPLFALLLATIFLNEVLTMLQWTGVVCILGGVALGELWRKT